MWIQLTRENGLPLTIHSDRISAFCPSIKNEGSIVYLNGDINSFHVKETYEEIRALLGLK